MATEMKVRKDEIEIIKLSASSMKTFDQCPRKYYYNYIDKQPKKTWDHLDLGNLCHKALEIFHQGQVEGKLDKMMPSELMKKAFYEAKKDFNVKYSVIQEAFDLVGKYLTALNNDRLPNVYKVEKDFNFHIADDVKIRGYLDRVDIEGNDYHIIDYKTTKNEKYLDPFQLTVYGLWLQKEFPDVEQFKGSYLLLRHNSKLKSYDINKEDLKKCKAKILKFAEQIKDCKQQDIWVPIPTPLCNWCDFKAICPTQTW